MMMFGDQTLHDATCNVVDSLTELGRPFGRAMGRSDATLVAAHSQAILLSRSFERIYYVDAVELRAKKKGLY